MSLRVRLTLLSTIVMAVLFTLFGAISYTVVQHMMYQPVDDVLELQSTAQIVTIWYRQPPDLSQAGGNDPLSSVFYTFYDEHGHVAKSEGPVLVQPDLISRGLAGETTKATIPAVDGHRVRVLLKPLTYRPNGQIVGVLQVAMPLDITDQRLSQLTWFLAGTSLALIVVAALGSFYLMGRALRAVDRVTQRVQLIESSHDLTQRIPETGTNDELGHLVSTFNKLIERLQSAFETQRRFVADSSHELRTPLTVIRSNMHLLRRSTDESEKSELIEITEAEVSRLNRMVNDLLYMAQMQAGFDLKPVLRNVELDSLLLDVFARARSIAALKNQKLVLAHEDIASTMGDRDQLQHLLLNLVDNAIKYTPDYGLITLGLWAERNWARIEVTDTGPGIPADSLQLVFDRFFRTQEARLTERNGSGLGLAIVKSIAEAHGGRVEVFSRIGEGTTFRLWLPSQNALPSDDEPEAEQEGTEPAESTAVSTPA